MSVSNDQPVSAENLKAALKALTGGGVRPRNANVLEQ